MMKRTIRVYWVLSLLSAIKYYRERKGEIESR